MLLLLRISFIYISDCLLWLGIAPLHPLGLLASSIPCPSIPADTFQRNTARTQRKVSQLHHLGILLTSLLPLFSFYLALWVTLPNCRLSQIPHGDRCLTCLQALSPHSQGPLHIRFSISPEPQIQYYAKPTTIVTSRCQFR